MSVSLCKTLYVNQVLKYLKSSPGRGILMKNNGRVDIVGYAEADWAGNSFDRKSTNGFYMFVGENLVIWKSKKQTSVARSSAETKYHAIADATSEIVWLHLLLLELGHKQTDEPTTLYCDNQAVVYIASNHVFHERTKHIKVNYHYVRENVHNGIKTPYIRSEDQLTDIFTKTVIKGAFETMTNKLIFNGLYESA
jgi:hypothetical protein